MTTASLTIQERHLEILRGLLLREDGEESAAYLLCGEAFIETDPWDGQPHRKFISHEVVAVPEGEVISRSDMHITWKTNSFVRSLKQAQDQKLTVAIVHSHAHLAAFSEQDDRNEPDLVELAQHRNGEDTRLLSLILMPTGELFGRLWVSQQVYIPLGLIRVVGKSIRLHYSGRGQGLPAPAFQRQALAFGEALNQDLSMLRVGVVGCGGTGSAIAMLLSRLGFRHMALFDKDIVEESNLNRLHGAFPEDAVAKRPKVEAIARSLEGLGIQVRTFQAWIGEEVCRDALKSCDIVFGCTDDHSGRLLLNRFAYYYATSVFDLGLAIEVSQDNPPRILCADGRVTVLLPDLNHTCLLCRGVINPVRAREEDLKRNNPAEYERQKTEAYVFGEGNPSPAVVTFTTEVANMALEELLQRLQGFRGEDGWVAQRVRKFHLMEDRRQGGKSQPDCPICASSSHWGIGDVEPFLGVV